MNLQKALLGILTALTVANGTVMIPSQVVVGKELNYDEPAIVAYLQLTDGKASFPPKSQISYIKVINSELKLDKNQVSYLEGVNSKIEAIKGFIASALIKGGVAQFNQSTISSISVDVGGKVKLKGGKVASLLINRGVVEVEGVKFTTEGYSQVKRQVEERPGKIILYPNAQLRIKGNYTLQNRLITITYPGGVVTTAHLIVLKGGNPAKLITTE
ncbi:MAG: hypothetical protein ABGW77_05020 [Campylobacterales bacterium]